MIALVSLDPEPYGLVSQTAKPSGMNFTVKGSGNSIPGVLPPPPPTHLAGLPGARYVLGRTTDIAPASKGMESSFKPETS